MIKTLTGETYKNIDIDYNNSYHYNDIKKLFSSLSQDKYFIITLNNNKIYSNLYDIIELKNKIFKFEKFNIFNIIFLPYAKSDCYNIKFNFKPKTDKNLKDDYNLSIDNLENDKLFMLYCVNINGILLDYASQELKSDLYLVYNAYINNYKSFQFASDLIKNDYSTINTFFDINLIYKYLSENLRNNKDYALLVLNKNIKKFKFIGNSLKTKEFISELFNLDSFNCNIIQYFPDDLKNDKEFVIKCIDNNNNNNNNKRIKLNNI